MSQPTHEQIVEAVKRLPIAVEVNAQTLGPVLDDIIDKDKAFDATLLTEQAIASAIAEVRPPQQQNSQAPAEEERVDGAAEGAGPSDPPPATPAAEPEQPQAEVVLDLARKAQIQQELADLEIEREELRKARVRLEEELDAIIKLEESLRPADSNAIEIGRHLAANRKAKGLPATEADKALEELVKPPTHTPDGRPVKVIPAEEPKTTE